MLYQEAEHSANGSTKSLGYWGGIAGGAALLLWGLRRGSLGLLALGGGLLANTLTGGRYVRKLVHKVEEVNWGEPQTIERAIIINRPPESLYAFWRDLTNLPRFMQSVQSVTTQDGQHSHWVAKFPFGVTMEWEAEITKEVENEMIAWRSLPGSEVHTSGIVTFERLPDDRGTRVVVTMTTTPPGGRAGLLAAKAMGRDPEKELREDLRRFKQLMETGEIPTTEGQSSGQLVPAIA